MTSTQKIQNKPLLIAVIIIAASVGLSVAWFAGQSRLAHDSALTRASALMQATCQKECEAHGLKAADLQGPFDAPTNAQPGNTKFDFKWKAPNGHDALIVRVWDNGLYIQAKQHWIDERKGKPW